MRPLRQYLCWFQFTVMLLCSIDKAIGKGSRSSEDTSEFRLLRGLFSNYDREVRPVYNNTDQVNVEFSLKLIQIHGVNSKSQLLITSSWIKQVWKNPMLSWNTSQYGGIRSVNVEASKVWIPDVILYNNADDSYGGGTEKYKTQVILHSNGQNEWFSPASFTSTCKINVEYFPFDKQNCSLKFGSWTYGGDRLTMSSESDSADLSMFIPNGEWLLVRMPSKLNKVYYNCCKYPFYDVTLNLIIKRKPLYYVFNLILPCALIATLNLLKFFLPPESGEKVGLGITVLLAMTVFLLLVADTLPATSDHIPLLGQYFIATMFVTALSLVGTCIVLNFFHRNPSTSPMPRWVRVIILGYMAKVFCFQTEDKETEVKIKPTKRKIEFDIDGDGEIALERAADLRDPESPFRRPHNLDDISISVLRGRSISVISRKSSNSANQGAPNPLSERLLQNITVLAGDVQSRQDSDRQREEWRIAALVLDRMFFWLFLFTSFLTTFLIFYRGPVVDD